jgi:DNA-binding LacI/PurR family transcriptional regulator
MKDVALAAGVSQAAVSYAYSRPGKLSAGQVQHIMETAARLGYPGPNIVGASLRSGKVGAIGVMLMDTLSYAFTDPSTKLLLEGVVQSHKLDDLALTLLPLPHDATSLADGGRSALRGLVDGVIVHSLPDDHPALLVLRSRRIPIVIVDAPRLTGVPLVGIRDREAARAQVRHVMDLGHTSIGLIVERLRPDGHRGIVDATRRHESVERVNRERVEGYREEFEAAGVDFDSVPMVEAGAFDEASAATVIRTLLDTHDVSAIVATSDTMAISAVKVARERGLRVPEDVSVIGFDNAPDAEAFALTTIRQPMMEKGHIAATMLFKLLSGDNEVDSVILPHELVVRGTTGPCPPSFRQP